MLCFACSICQFYCHVNSGQLRLAVVSSLMIKLHLCPRPIEAMVTLSFASVLLLWTRFDDKRRNEGDIENLISGSISYDTELLSCCSFCIATCLSLR